MSNFVITNIQWDDEKKKQLKYTCQIPSVKNGNYIENIIEELHDTVI